MTENNNKMEIVEMLIKKISIICFFIIFLFLLNI